MTEQQPIDNSVLSDNDRAVIKNPVNLSDHD